MKKHLHFPFSLHVVSQIPILILADQESLINPEPGSSFSLGRRFRYLMYEIYWFILQVVAISYKPR